MFSLSMLEPCHVFGREKLGERVMNSAIERLMSLRVKDVMRREVLTIHDSESIKSAAAKLFQGEVTGAPVVDDAGRCVGIISGSDFVGKAADAHELQVTFRHGSASPDEIELPNDDLVSSHMCEEICSISPEANMLEAARRMCAYHVHRLVVLDDSQRPTGIISTLDIVAAMVAAVEE
jgi:CBS-domain-containing membrane protein